MKLSTVIMLSLCALLAGCDSERKRYATLYFDTPLSKSASEAGKESSDLYSGSVVDALRELGIKVEWLDFRLDKKDWHAVHIAVTDPSFGDHQKEALKKTLSDILQAKLRPPFSSHVVMDPGSPKFTVPKPQLYERSDNGVFIHPLPEMSISIEPAENDLSDTVIGRSSSGFNCYVSSKIMHDLPFRVAVWARSELALRPGDYSVILLAWNLRTSGAKMTFDNPDTTRLLVEGKLALVMKSGSPTDSVNNVSVRIASLSDDSNQARRSRQLTPKLYSDLRSQCLSMALKLGRPFTFHLGDGLDRLKAVVYTEQPAT